MIGFSEKNSRMSLNLILVFVIALLISTLPAQAKKPGFGGDQLRCYEKCEDCGTGATEKKFNSCLKVATVQLSECKRRIRNKFGNDGPYPGSWDICDEIKQFYNNWNDLFQGKSPDRTPRDWCKQQLHSVVYPDHQRCLKNIPACRSKC
jgi:hypothetical protein